MRRTFLELVDGGHLRSSEHLMQTEIMARSHKSSVGWKRYEAAPFSATSAMLAQTLLLVALALAGLAYRLSCVDIRLLGSNFQKIR